MNENLPSSNRPVSDEETQALLEQAGRYKIELIDCVADEMLDPALIKDLPVEWVRSNVVLPVRFNGDNCILTSDIDKVSQQEYLELLVGCDLKPVLASSELIRQSIERCYYNKEDSPKEFLRDMDVTEEDETKSNVRTDDLLQVAEQAPVTQLINLILLEAVKRNASDIHFEPFESLLRVRYRVDGVLYEQSSPPKNMEEAITSRLKVMAHMDIAERRLPQDGMARVRVGEREIDIRVSTIPVAEGERVVLRLLDKDATLLPMADLGMPLGMLGNFENLLSESNGIIIVSGPTGSGKTTTLYAALGGLDASRRNILTIEDPIEYQMAEIGQIQVKPKIGLTFASGLRHILRQDPDVVLVGETRDVETAEIAVRASLTGHLVFTTLHTNDAPGAVLRLMDMGVEPHLLSSCIRGVLAQRLVRKLCSECKNEENIDGKSAQMLGIENSDLKKAWKAKGCPSCLEGYKGRVGLFEMMVADNDLKELIRSGNTHLTALRELAMNNGMTTLLDDGVTKIRDAVTSVDEVIAVVGD